MPLRHVLLAAAAMAFTTPILGADAPPPLIERAKLFGNPTRTGGQLSPDGKWLGFIAPRDGVLNVWVAPVDRPDEARAADRREDAPDPPYFWSPDSKQILFVNDKGGDENFLLYGVDVASGAQKALTPFEKTRVQIVGAADTIKDRILVGVNNRDPRWHDVHELEPRHRQADAGVPERRLCRLRRRRPAEAAHRGQDARPTAASIITASSTTRSRRRRSHSARRFADAPRRSASPPTARRSTGSTARGRDTARAARAGHRDGQVRPLVARERRAPTSAAA